jgi:hypothetical protein
MDAIDPTDITQTPAPSFVVTEDDRARWDIAGKLAQAMWEANAPGAPLDNAFGGKWSGRSFTPTYRPGRRTTWRSSPSRDATPGARWGTIVGASPTVAGRSDW